MFTKNQEEFAAIAADAVRRAAAITELSKRNTRMFWASMAVTIASITAGWSGNQWGGMAMAAITWSILFKCESDLQLLRVVDRLWKDEKPEA